MSEPTGAWGMGFAIFARLVVEAAMVSDGPPDDASIRRCAETARRAVRIWHATKPSEPSDEKRRP